MANSPRSPKINLSTSSILIAGAVKMYRMDVDSLLEDVQKLSQDLQVALLPQYPRAYNQSDSSDSMDEDEVASSPDEDVQSPRTEASGTQASSNDEPMEYEPPRKRQAMAGPNGPQDANVQNNLRNPGNH